MGITPEILFKNRMNIILRSGEYSRQKTFKAGGIFMIVQDVVFNSVEDAQRFVSQAERWPSDVDVSLGSCMVLGVLSLGIHKKLHVTIHEKPEN